MILTDLEIALINNLRSKEPTPTIIIIIPKLPFIKFGTATSVSLALEKLPLILNFPFIIVLDTKPTFLRLEKLSLIDNPTSLLIPHYNLTSYDLILGIKISIQTFADVSTPFNDFSGIILIGIVRVRVNAIIALAF